jgi:membrane protein YdbS with pleckstrin-like domain
MAWGEMARHLGMENGGTAQAISGVKFLCPLCHQALQVPAESKGDLVDCPFCKQPIEVPYESLPEVTRTKTCPFCGEEILNIARNCKHCGAFLDGAAARHVSAGGLRKMPKPEQTLWDGHPSVWFYLPWWILGFVLIVFYGIGLLFIVYAILDRKMRVYTLTSSRVMSRAGIVSRETHEIAVKDIRCIYMKQSILDRLLGLGTVQIGSAGTAGIEVEFQGVRDPEKARNLVRKAKDVLDR